jgi:hypothetical protein
MTISRDDWAEMGARGILLFGVLTAVFGVLTVYFIAVPSLFFFIISCYVYRKNTL